MLSVPASFPPSSESGTPVSGIAAIDNATSLQLAAQSSGSSHSSHGKGHVAAVSKVEKIPGELLLTSLRPECIPLATGAILELMCFSPNGTHRFFSYTHTMSELSLLLDERTAKEAFPTDMLSIGPDSWRIIEIQEGSEILDVAGIVSSLTAPLLAQQQQELLYLSTFFSDLLLVREKDVDRSEQVVSNNLSFLIESRRKAMEALAAAEQAEEEHQRRQQAMEEEDRARAIAGETDEIDENDTEAGIPDGEGEGEVGIHSSLPLPIDARVPAPESDNDSISNPPDLPASVASSYISQQSEIFQFSWKSSTTHLTAGEDPAVKQRTSHAALVPAQHIPLTHGSAPPVSSPGHYPAKTPLSPKATATTSSLGLSGASSSLAQLSMEAEGEGGEYMQGGEGGAIAMHLSKLPFRLALLTFHVKHLPQCTHAILKSLLRPSLSSSTATENAFNPSSPSSSSSAHTPFAHFNPPFFSFTQAGSQISLIVETQCLQYFPAVVTQHRRVWNAIQVSQGSESTDSASLVGPLSSCLAKVGVSIYYLSTFNLDFILVAEKEVELALNALTHSMNVMVEQ